jgi:hypothetical protein
LIRALKGRKKSVARMKINDFFWPPSGCGTIWTRKPVVTRFALTTGYLLSAFGVTDANIKGSNDHSL